MANIKNFGIVGLGSNVQFGKGGAKLVQSEGTFAAKSADNAAFVRFAIANAVAADDAVTLQQLNAAVAASGANLALLQGEVDRIETAAGLNADGTYSAPAEGTLAGATSLKDADDKLAAALAQELLDRAAADSDLADAVEVANAKANTVGVELDVTQASIGLTPEGALNLADGNYLANATTIVAAVEALDAAAKAARDAAATAQSEVDLVEGRVGTLESNASAQGDAIYALESNTVAQQGEIDSAHSRLDGHDTAISNLQAAINDDTRLDNLEANASAQGNAIVDLIAADAALDTRLDTAEGDITALENNAVAQQTAIDTAAGRLTTAEGEIDTLQTELNAAEAAHSAHVANAIVRDGSVAMAAALNMGNNVVSNVADPVAATDAANKQWVEGKVANLGNAFEYKGVLANGGAQGSAYDLENIDVADRGIGDYYKVTAAGHFKLGAAGAEMFFNVNDGLVFSTTGFDKIDNTDSVSRGTAGQIAVSGSVDTGFDISIDGAYTAARQLEVTNEANARAAADAVLTNAVADVVADLAAEVLDRAADELALANATALVASNLAAEVTARSDADTALGGRIDDVENDLAAEVTARTNLGTALWDNAVAQQTAIDLLEAAVGDDTRIEALEGRVDAHDGLLNGLESNAAAQDTRLDNLEAADIALDGRLDTAESKITVLESNAVAQAALLVGLEANAAAQDTRLDAHDGLLTGLEANAGAQQSEIDALELALENLSQDTITSEGEIYSVHAADTAVEFRADAIAAGIDLTLSATEARLTAVSTADDADLRLVAKGTGQVIIGDDGVGIIQADDGFDMTVAAGAGNTGTQVLHLKGDVVAIEDQDGAAVAKFVGGGSAFANVSTTNGAVTFAADGAAVDVDLVFDPKGAGRVDVSGAKVVNVGNAVAATDAVNYGQLLDAVAGAEVGHVVSVAASVSLTGVVNLGEVTGLVTRVRVVILNAYNAGASIKVGTDNLAADLVSAVDVDESAAGVYIIETAREYEAADLVVTIEGATSGAAKVYVEYIKG